MHAYALVGMFTRNLESRPEAATIGNSASSFVSRACLPADSVCLAVFGAEEMGVECGSTRSGRIGRQPEDDHVADTCG
jgi:hypothetical protein